MSRLWSLQSDMVGYWPLHEASGDAYDVGGRGLTLTDTNTVTAAEGKVITSRQFTNATSERLIRATESAFEMGDTDFSIACWAYLDNKTGLQGLVVKDDAATAQRDYILLYHPTSDRFEFYVFRPTDAAVSVACNALGSPAVATWYFVVAWHDSDANTVNIEVNGLLNSAATGGALQAANSANFAVGSYSGGTNALDGRVCEVGLWKRILSIQERWWLYNSGLGRTYPFDGIPSPAMLGRHPAADWRRNRMVGVAV